MYVATKKLHPHISSSPRHMGWMILWLWGLISSEIRHIVLLRDQGDGSRSCFYSAYKAEESMLALPRCLKHRGQENKGFLKREKTVFLLQCSLFLYSQRLQSAASSSEQVRIEANIGFLQEEGWPKPSCPFLVWCTLALLAVCLLSLCITVSPIEIGTRGN